MTDQTTGLTTEQAEKLQTQFGKNELSRGKRANIFQTILHIAAEPMFLLLIAAAVIYFFLGEVRDGTTMLVFVIGVIAIDIVQQWKTDKTLGALRELSAPKITVVRDSREQEIASADLVPGDVMIVCEGIKIPADGRIVKCSDLRVDESTLTGESEPVWKSAGEAEGDQGHWRKDYCYAGTLVLSGTGTVIVDRIGLQTEYGKISRDVAEAGEKTSPLSRQINKLVKICAALAAALTVLVGVATYLNLSDHALGPRVVESILSGITLAMAMIPEEFPVVLTVFLSMGAWRLAKNHSLVRRLSAVETLGAVSVLCVDKTGTITQNRMEVRQLWATGDEDSLCEMAGLACETDAYDPMEQALLKFCEQRGVGKSHLFGGTLLTEYSFTNELKMMGHVWNHDNQIIAACKGSPEQILMLCNLSEAERAKAQNKALEMSSAGLRVIAVGFMLPASKEQIPQEITACRLSFAGLIGLADPPRESVKEDIAACLAAGVRVVMITGDNGITARSIADAVGIPKGDCITGDMLDAMTDEELMRRVKTANVFARTVPNHKLRIVKALRECGEVVAMTGDGVNDAPALKYADIGIAMGKRGSEVSREAADLILLDDNFSTVVSTIRDGRRIYDNIRKAVGYIFAIHLPIALASLLAPMIGIAPANLMLLPLHVMLLELMIDPTCSIVLERQPAERDLMRRPPRNPNDPLLSWSGMMRSVVQGLVIFAASFGLYLYVLGSGGEAQMARGVGFAVLVLANVLLVQVNASDRDSIITTMKELVGDSVTQVSAGLTVLGLLAVLYSPMHVYLKISTPSIPMFGCALTAALASVLWYEIVKWAKRRNER